MRRDSPQIPLTICIASPTAWAYSETFIQTHIEKLPFNIVQLNGPSLTVTSLGEELLERSFIEVRLHGLKKRLGFFEYSRFVDARIAEFFRRYNVAAVIGEYGLVAAKLVTACQMVGIPLIGHFHGYDAHNRDTIRKQHRNYQRLFQNADAIIGVSKFMCQSLASLGAAANRLHYIPYYVDPTIFQAAFPALAPAQFLAVGRFVEKKAPYLTLLAFAKTLQEYPDATLEMIGDGWLMVHCKRMAEALGISNSVTFSGAKSHEYVSRAIRKSRCFVQHSVQAENGDCEGTPVAILEAQCAGVPVVATRHAGIIDVVDENKTGFLVAENDVDGMARAMCRLAGDAGLAGRMGQAATIRIKSEFGFDQTLGKLAHLILNLVDPK